MVKLVLQCMQLKRPGNMSVLGRKGNGLVNLMNGSQVACNCFAVHALKIQRAFKFLHRNRNFGGLGSKSMSHYIITGWTSPLGRWGRVHGREGVMGGLLMCLQAVRTKKTGITCEALMECRAQANIIGWISGFPGNDC